MNIKILCENIENNHTDFNADRLEDLFTEFAEQYRKEQCTINVVSVSLPTDPMVLAEYLHDAYETIAKKTKWNTQENCKVPFKELPNENKNTMILLAGKLILDFGGN
jgi:hypothetical protein